MRIERLAAALAVCALTLALPLPAPAAEPEPSPPRAAAGQSVGVVDLENVFANHPRFKKMMSALRDDMNRTEEQVKRETRGLAQMAEELKKAKPGTPEHQKLQGEIGRRESELKVHVELQKRDFFQREAKIYQSAYQEIVRDVESYAKSHNLSAVLKINREPADAARPDDIRRGLSSPVVWFAEDLDITSAIADRVSKGQNQPAPSSRRSGNPAGTASVLSALGKAVFQDDGQPRTLRGTVAIKVKEEPSKKEASPKNEKPPAKAVEKAAAKPGEKAPEKPADKSAEKKPEPKKLSVVRLVIKGSYPEGPAHSGLFGDLQPSLAKMIQRLEEAAADKNVAAIWLRIEDLEAGRGKIHELRAAVARARKAGKPVYAELTGGDTAQYLLAIACDEVFMPCSGTLMVPGVRAEMTFYKGLLEKVGLEFDALQMGKYKGAVEPMTRTGMSGPLRESMEAIVDDTYEETVRVIAADRKLKDYVVKTLLDQGLFTAAAARKAGLVDQVMYADEFEDYLRKKLKADQLDVVTTYKKKQVETDFSGVGGLMKLMEVLAGGKTPEKAGAKHKIALVYAVGPIVEGKSTNDLFGESAVGSTTMCEAIRKASEDPKVKAIVLRVDSPGGSATASDLIWRETVRTKKPVIASMGDVAGSGGYYISMSAKRIFAEPGTITGSIGVIGGKLVTRGLYEKLGLTTEVISRGKNSGSLSSAQPFSAEERKVWTELLTETYGQFVSKAAEGRKMDRARVEQLAQGRVYTGRMAKGNGLVDELGTLHDAIAAAKKAAGLKADEEVDLMILPKPKTVLEQLFGDASVTTDLESAAPELFRVLKQTKLLRQLLSEPRLLWMPYGVKVK